MVMSIHPSIIYTTYPIRSRGIPNSWFLNISDVVFISEKMAHIHYKTLLCILLILDCVFRFLPHWTILRSFLSLGGGVTFWDWDNWDLHRHKTSPNLFLWFIISLTCAWLSSSREFSTYFFRDEHITPTFKKGRRRSQVTVFCFNLNSPTFSFLTHLSCFSLLSHPPPAPPPTLRPARL